MSFTGPVGPDTTPPIVPKPLGDGTFRLAEKLLAELSKNDQRVLFLTLSAALEVFAGVAGIRLLCFTFYRDPRKQAALVKKGLSATRHSKHTLWRAKDYVVLDAETPLWDVPRPIPAENPYRKLGEFWEQLHPEARWGGRWRKPFDPYHFEL